VGGDGWSVSSGLAGPWVVAWTVVVTLVTGEIVTCAGAAPDGRQCLSPGGTRRRAGREEGAIDGGLLEELADVPLAEGGLRFRAGAF
jgi:hypothetical protein